MQVKNKLPLTLATLLIGSIFLFSGIVKGIDIDSFGELLKMYGSPYLYFLAPVISSLELFVGFAMVFLASPKKMSFVALFLTLLFTIIYAIGYFLFDIADCGCFGNIIKIPAYASFIRNILLIALAWYVWRYYPNKISTRWNCIRLITACLFAIAAFVIGSLEIRSGYFRGLQKARFVGMHINETPLTSIIESPGKNYMVFIFLPGCGHCQRAVPHVRKYWEVGLIDAIVGIYPSYANKDEVDRFVKENGINFPVQSEEADKIYSLIVGYPTVYWVKNDTVSSYFIGKIPQPK